MRQIGTFSNEAQMRHTNKPFGCGGPFCVRGTMISPGISEKKNSKNHGKSVFRTLVDDFVEDKKKFNNNSPNTTEPVSDGGRSIG